MEIIPHAAAAAEAAPRRIYKNPRTESLVDYALDLARRGFFIHPLNPNAKTPALENWPQLATRDEATIRDWWRQNSRYNVGIYTGRFGSGQALVVVDVDVKADRNGFDALLALELEGLYLPPTLTAHTPSGGRHLFYVSPEAVKQGTNVLGTAVDIRSRGGYVVGAGSVIDGKPYHWLDDVRTADAPQWLIDRCGRVPARKEANREPLPGVDPDRARERAVHYLSQEAPVAYSGERNDTGYRVACRLKDLGVVQAECAALMLEHWTGCEPMLELDELEHVVRSAYRYGTEPPGSAAPEAEFGPVSVPPDEATEAEAARASDFRLVSVSEVMSQLGPIEWQVERFIEANSIGVFFGAPASYKSFVALDMALCTAAGKPWHGHPVRQGPVVYIAGEGHNGMARRILAWGRRNNVDVDSIPFYLSARAAALCDRRHARAVHAAVDGIAEAHGAPAMVVIDTLARNFGGDENTAQDMGAFIDHVSRHLCAPYGASVIIVHHTGKDKDRGARGSTALRAGADFEYSVERPQELVATLTCTKMKDAPEPPPVHFQGHRVAFDFTEHGGHLADSLAFAIADGAAALDRRDLSGRARRALELLEELAAAGGGPFAAAPVAIREWQERCKAERLAEGRADAVRQAIKRARLELETKGFIRCNGRDAEVVLNA